MLKLVIIAQRVQLADDGRWKPAGEHATELPVANPAKVAEANLSRLVALGGLALNLKHATDTEFYVMRWHIEASAGYQHH